jgi:hypothetical protein
MQLTIDIKESALEKIMYFLDHLKDDVKIISKSTDLNNLEIINEDDSDFNYVIDAKEARENGEKLYSLEDVIKEFK